jgi:hypothetical protein
MISNATGNAGNATPQQLLVFRSEEPLPSFGRLCSQGAYSGALGYLLSVLFGVIANPQAFGLYIVVVVPFVLAYGAVFGLIVAVVMWVIINVAERPLGRLARLAVTAGVELAIFFICGLLFSSGSMADYSQLFVMFAAIVLPVGLTTGSHYAPGRAFLHGMRRSALLSRLRLSRGHEFWLGTAISFVFRMVNVLVCVQSFFLLIGIATDHSTRQDLLVVSLIFAYFLLQTVFSFDNAHSSSLVLLTIVANVAGTYAVFEYAQQLEFVRFILGGYLLLWFVFLMTHWGGMKPLSSHIKKQLDPLLISIKKELRYYYLID